jgi:hypothetical protein
VRIAGPTPFGGPLEVLEVLTPVMSVTTLLLSLATEQLWHVLPSSPYFNSLPHVLITMLLILTGALIAFLMVWAEYQVGAGLLGISWLTVCWMGWYAINMAIAADALGCLACAILHC